VANGGTRDCESPSCPPVIELGHDSVADAGWLWLSKQVKFILSVAQLPAAPLLPVIRQSSKARGLWARSGVDSSAILQALESRFGRTLLTGVGVLASSGSQAEPTMARPASGQSLALAGDFDLPDVLRTLLLTALVATDVAELAETPVTLDTKGVGEPQGYGGEKQLGRDLLSRGRSSRHCASANVEVHRRVQPSTGQPSHARGRHATLGHSPSRCPSQRPAALARRQLQQSAQLCGLERRSTGSKSSLGGSSEWSIQLIELDDLELASLHRSATIEVQRSKHRETVTTYLQSSPERREDGRRRCSAYPPLTGWAQVRQ
jgi:hypothetical protein